MDEGNKNVEEKKRRYEEAIQTNRVWVAEGCDSGILRVRALCEYLHNDRYKKGSGWTAYCDVCHRALKKAKSENPDAFQYDGGGYFAPTNLVLEYIHKVEAEVEDAEKKAKEEEDKIIQEILTKRPTDFSEYKTLSKEKRIEIAKTLAKELGKDIIAARYTTGCDGTAIDCSWDVIEIVVNPNGSQKTRRIHTY